MSDQLCELIKTSLGISKVRIYIEFDDVNASNSNSNSNSNSDWNGRTFGWTFWSRTWVAIGLLDHIPNDPPLDFVAENSNWVKTAPWEQWFAISRDLFQNGIAWLLLKLLVEQAFGGLPAGDWFFMTFTIIGLTHVILLDLKSPSGMSSALKPWHCSWSAITKPRREQYLSWPQALGSNCLSHQWRQPSPLQVLNFKR